MEWLNIVLVALVGASIGSFVNVVADRVPRGQSLVSPPSHCPACDRKLGGIDLIPVLSYLFLRGKCRTCGSKIPMRIVAVELAFGVTFAITWALLGPSFKTVLMLAYISLFASIFLIDIEHKIIPNVIVFPSFVVVMIASSFVPEIGPLKATLGAVSGFGVMLALYLIPGAVIGEGDVKLAAVLGAATGFPVIFLAVGLSFVLGGGIAAILLVTGIKSRKQQMAFGPYIAVSAVISLVWGDVILAWYLTNILQLGTR